MKRVFLKLRARGGESFAEILVALLIVALATLLLASMVGASGSIDMATRKEDEAFYEAVSAVEERDTSATGATTTNNTVKITPTTGAVTGTQFTVDVSVYEKDGLTAYEKR